MPHNYYLNNTITTTPTSFTNDKNGCLTFQNKFHFIQEKISILWLLLGTIGNLLSLLVLLRRKMRIHSTFTYLMLLSICDTLVLYLGLLRDFLVYKYDFNINSKIICKLHVFSFYFVLHMASWLLVAVNIDRLIASSFLSFSKIWCTPNKALMVTLIIAFILALINGHFLYYVDAKPQKTTTNFTIDDTTEPVNPFVYSQCIVDKKAYKLYNFFFQNIFTWIDTTTQVILPFIIMIICNCNIIYKVLLTNKKTKGKNLKRLRKIKGMCVMILTVSILFFILELPVLIFICLMQGELIPKNSSCNEFLFIVTNLMMYTNHVINFVSYCMTGTKFRRELIRMFQFDKLMSLLRSNNIITKNNFEFINGAAAGGNFNRPNQTAAANNLINLKANVFFATNRQPRKKIVKVNKNSHNIILNNLLITKNQVEIKKCCDLVPLEHSYVMQPVNDEEGLEHKSVLLPLSLANLFMKKKLNGSESASTSPEMNVRNNTNSIELLNPTNGMNNFISSINSNELLVLPNKQKLIERI
jgi:hypothetical protein